MQVHEQNHQFNSNLSDNYGEFTTHHLRMQTIQLHMEVHKQNSQFFSNLCHRQRNPVTIHRSPVASAKDPFTHAKTTHSIVTFPTATAHH